MDLLRLQCFPKERDYLQELASWSQKMGFACLAIIERPAERRRLTDQIGNMMIPDMSVSSTIDCYIDASFPVQHEETLQWLTNKDKHVENPTDVETKPRASPARHPLTMDTITLQHQPEVTRLIPANVNQEANPATESRSDENITDEESDSYAQPGTVDQPTSSDVNGNDREPLTPLSLSSLLNSEKRLLLALKKHRKILCKSACMIDQLIEALPSPFIPLYNKAGDEMKDLTKRIQKRVKRLAYHLFRYLKFLDQENKLREQIYQNLQHVTPLQVLLLGHLPRDQQMALLNIISAVRKFSTPLLMNRFEEMRRCALYETEENREKLKIHI